MQFDLEALKNKLKSVTSGKVCGWPSYDRLLHNPVEDAINIDGDIIIEPIVMKTYSNSGMFRRMQLLYISCPHGKRVLFIDKALYINMLSV